jgi:hypothetical protein
LVKQMRMRIAWTVPSDKLPFRQPPRKRRRFPVPLILSGDLR